MLDNLPQQANFLTSYYKLHRVAKVSHIELQRNRAKLVHTDGYKPITVRKGKCIVHYVGFAMNKYEYTSNTEPENWRL